MKATPTWNVSIAWTGMTEPSAVRAKQLSSPFSRKPKSEDQHILPMASNENILIQGRRSNAPLTTAYLSALESNSPCDFFFSA